MATGTSPISITGLKGGASIATWGTATPWRGTGSRTIHTRMVESLDGPERVRREFWGFTWPRAVNSLVAIALQRVDILLVTVLSPRGVPSALAPLLSTALMTAVPAKVAGVAEVSVVLTDDAEQREAEAIVVGGKLAGVDRARPFSVTLEDRDHPPGTQSARRPPAPASSRSGRTGQALQDRWAR
mgnify:CR=1 FL=1